jgi:hypothetical protein
MCVFSKGRRLLRDSVMAQARYPHAIIGVLTIMGSAFGMKSAQVFADARIAANLFAARVVATLLNAFASHADP